MEIDWTPSPSTYEVFKTTTGGSWEITLGSDPGHGGGGGGGDSMAEDYGSSYSWTLLSTDIKTPLPVPLPASAPLFGASLVALGAAGYGLKRKQDAMAA